MPKVDESSARRKFNIKTVYYRGNMVTKVTRAAHANSAVPRCVDHLQLNHYEAFVAEVFDELNGVLHAVITRSVKGNIKIVFKRHVEEGM